MIEKKIFQTYKKEYHELDDYAIHTSRTWIEKNPEWEYNYYSDESILDFTSDVFGKEWLDILLNKCPVGVMRSDIWRCMAVYNYGGIYADLDTICTDSIDLWGLDLSKEAIFNVEQSGFILNWAFMGRAKSRVFEIILENIQRNIHEQRTLSIDYVYKTTGPIVFTESIKNYIDKNNNDIQIINDYNYFTSNKVVHLNAAKYWNFESYDSWNKELESILNETI
jgi:mannosyltransferase OCH1-like enzyme